MTTAPEGAVVYYAADEDYTISPLRALHATAHPAAHSTTHPAAHATTHSTTHSTTHKTS